MAALSESELPRAGRGAALAWRLASDEALARAASRGQQAAFSALFDRYHAPLERYCRSILLNAEDAQDAAQNALTAALRALRDDRTPPVRLKPWLYRIAHNEALAVARRRPGNTPLDDHAEAVAPDDCSTREQLRELLGDLQTLPERQRSALVMRELSGLSYAEIAGALSVSEPAARQSVFEARGALHSFRDGRAAACADVRKLLSDGDGRTRRSRALRAHLDSCQGCAAFAAEIAGRRRQLRLLFPLPGVGLATGLLATGGATVATKCAAVCATALVVGGGIAAVETGHHARHGKVVSATAIATPAAVRPQVKTAPRPRAPQPVQTRRVALLVPATPKPKPEPQPRPKTRAPHHVAKKPQAQTEAHVPAATTTTTTPAPPPPPAETTTVAAVTPAPASSPAQTSQTTQTTQAKSANPVKEIVETTLAKAQEVTAKVLTNVQSGLEELKTRLKSVMSGNAPTENGASQTGQ